MVKRSTLPTIVYSFGAKAPHENREGVEEQFSLAHKYRNALTEVMRWWRKANKDWIQLRHPDVAAAGDVYEAAALRVEALMEEIQKIRQKARKRIPIPEPQKSQFSQAKKDKTAAWQTYKTLREPAYADPVTAAGLVSNKEEAKRRHKELRRLNRVGNAEGKKLYWGTGGEVDVAALQANSGKKPPKFQRWTGNGQLVVQISGGISVDELWQAKHTQVRAEIVPGTNPKRPWCILWLRIGSTGKGKLPVWTKVRFRLQRPLPKTSRIQRCAVQRRNTAGTYTWAVLFTLADAQGFPKPTASKGAVGVDIGWRRVPEGLRVAAWKGTDGREGTLILPELVLTSLQKTKELRSGRDKDFDAIRAVFKKWLKKNEHPEWLREATVGLMSWKSCARLAGLVWRWQKNRFTHDGGILAKLEAWRRHDKHLWCWEANERKSAFDRRTSIYRQFARELAEAYGTIVIEKFSLAEMAKLPEVDEDPDEQAVKLFRALAGTSYLREALKSSGATVAEYPAKNTTRDCSLCGVTNTFTSPELLIQTCQGCGASWDQDENAAANLLRRHAASGPGPA